MTQTLAEVLAPTRGSGLVQCSEPTCHGHRAKCLFGGQHTWITWYEDGQLMRTADTYRCAKCQGVCTGEEGL